MKKTVLLVILCINAKISATPTPHYPISELILVTSDINLLSLEKSEKGLPEHLLAEPKKNIKLPKTTLLSFDEIYKLAAMSIPPFIADIYKMVVGARILYGNAELYDITYQKPELSLAGNGDGSYIARLFCNLTFKSVPPRAHKNGC